METTYWAMCHDCPPLAPLPFSDEGACMLFVQFHARAAVRDQEMHRITVMASCGPQSPWQSRSAG